MATTRPWRNRQYARALEARGRKPVWVRIPPAAPPPTFGTKAGGVFVSQPNSSRTTGTSARNALPRWLIAFFSAAVSSAQVRVAPSGWRIGS